MALVAPVEREVMVVSEVLPETVVRELLDWSEVLEVSEVRSPVEDWWEIIPEQ